ncbi:MAG: sn-glycerol-1-phosphate dehydrogenase [Candidatus Korarchaeota archaeon]
MSMIHEILLPERVYVGYNVFPKIPEYLKIRGFRKPLILTDKNTVDISGRVLEKLILDAIVETINGKDLINVVKEESVDVVIGNGGGRVIDSAKIVAHATNIPYISVPTAASHDGISSPIAVTGPGKSIFVGPPIAIFMDMGTILSAPRRLLISGCGDLIAKVNAVMDWEFAHRKRGEYFGNYAASLARNAGYTVIENAEGIATWKPEAVRNILEALISSGVAMCIAGSSRPCSGSEHLFSHALDITLPNKSSLHGEQCGVGTIMMQYLHSSDWSLIKKVLMKIGAPVNADELGIEETFIVRALTMAHTIRDRYTILGVDGITEEAAWELIKATGVSKFDKGR